MPAHEDKTTKTSPPSKTPAAESKTPGGTDFDTDSDGRSEHAPDHPTLRDDPTAVVAGDADAAPGADGDGDDDDVAVDELGQRMDDPGRR